MSSPVEYHKVIFLLFDISCNLMCVVTESEDFFYSSPMSFLAPNKLLKNWFDFKFIMENEYSKVQKILISVQNLFSFRYLFFLGFLLQTAQISSKSCLVRV